jgi:hypothetical protein
MRIELISNGLWLSRGQVLRVVDGAGGTIRTGNGTVWFTEENRPCDVILGAGASYQLRQPGVGPDEIYSILLGKTGVVF